MEIWGWACKFFQKHHWFVLHRKVTYPLPLWRWLLLDSKCRLQLSKDTFVWQTTQQLFQEAYRQESHKSNLSALLRVSILLQVQSLLFWLSCSLKETDSQVLSLYVWCLMSGSAWDQQSTAWHSSKLQTLWHILLSSINHPMICLDKAQAEETHSPRLQKSDETWLC